MNHGSPPDMFYPAHMSGGQPPAPHSVSHHQQPPALLPGVHQYAPPQPSYAHYGYPGGLASPHPASHQVSASLEPQGQSNALSLPSLTAASPVMHAQAYPSPQQQFDTTGQIAPPGMRPRVTATLWEDEGSLCYQVESRGICVARRQDNHMINGTKLLNVAGMTRGRRDGILKSEKVRNVVKIGPMHLKGVWIPFERALDFANKEKITPCLYPLFVHNIGALLYHPANQSRTHGVMAAAEHRKHEQSQSRNQPVAALPSMQPHHHHSIGALPATPHPVSGDQKVGRPDIHRAHTFPTPPTSASSMMGGMGPSDGSYGWGAQGPSPLAIDTGLKTAHSLPTTSEMTPPGASIQSMQPYHHSSQSYDPPKSLYSAPPLQSPYQSSNGAGTLSRYAHPNTPYVNVKSEMAPLPGRVPVSGPGGEQHDVKATNGLLHHPQANGRISHGHDEEEAEHENDHEYTHENTTYDPTRDPYNHYAAEPPVASLAPGHGHISPELTHSPNHQNGSGRATPLTTATSHGYYPQHQGEYSPPPRALPPSSNLYNVMSSERGTANGGVGGEMYSSQPNLSSLVTNGYAGQQPAILNGATAATTNKRGRDDDDYDQRPSSRGTGDDIETLKRRRIANDDSIPSPTYGAPLSRARAAVSVSQRR